MTHSSFRPRGVFTDRFDVCQINVKISCVNHGTYFSQYSIVIMEFTTVLLQLPHCCHFIVVMLLLTFLYLECVIIIWFYIFDMSAHLTKYCSYFVSIIMWTSPLCDSDCNVQVRASGWGDGWEQEGGGAAEDQQWAAEETSRTGLRHHLFHWWALAHLRGLWDVHVSVK